MSTCAVCVCVCDDDVMCRMHHSHVLHPLLPSFRSHRVICPPPPPSPLMTRLYMHMPHAHVPCPCTRSYHISHITCHASHTHAHALSGYYTYDGWFDCSPTCTRAVEESVAALRARGHTCVAFTPPNMWEAVHLYFAIMTADACQSE